MSLSLLDPSAMNSSSASMLTFPGLTMVFIVASTILLFIISLLQDMDQQQWRFSLRHLLFFVTMIALLLGMAVKIVER